MLNLVRRDLTVRYRATVLGFFWSFLKPLAYMGIYHIIFGEIIHMQIRQEEIPYALHVLAALLPWTFFQGASSEAMHSILDNANLIKKVKVPAAVFPVATVISNSIHFALAMLVVVAVMIPWGLAPGPLFLLLPALFAVQFILVMSVSLVLAALNVFFRDVVSIWEVAGAAWFYATPIIYPAYIALDYLSEKTPAWAHWLYLANPMTPITLGYRRIMLYGSLGGGEGSTGPLDLEISDADLIASIGLATMTSLCMLWIAYRIFVRLSRRFADEL